MAFDLRVDEEPRLAATPEDLVDALDEQGVRETFETMGPGMRRHFIRWIDEAVAESTRTKRLAHVVGERLMERYGCESVRVRAAKPEPPLPLAIQEIAVEITQERAVDDDDSSDG